jgi:hypothetical protein
MGPPRWPRSWWLRLLLAPILLPIIAVYGVLTLFVVLPLLFVIGWPASIIVAAAQRRRYVREHLGETIFLCTSECRLDRSCNILLHNLYNQVVRSVLPDRCRMVLFDGTFGAEQLQAMKGCSRARPRPLPADYPWLVLVRGGGMPAISLRPEFEALFARWAASEDVRSAIACLLQAAGEELRSGAAHVLLPEATDEQ